MSRGLYIAIVAGLTVSSLAQEASLPVTGITLYRSGVGYFQRQGMIDGNAQVQLRFKTEQINDILKSLVLLDMGGGQIDAVSYSSKEPLQKRLSAFAVDISDAPDMPKLLSRLRGAPLAVETPDGRITGTILSVEQQTVAEGQGTFGTHFVNLLTERGIRSIKVRDISAFDILDPQLADELNKALAALAEHRTDMVKGVDLGFRGAGAREVLVAYIHEMPVWKTSYRLILPEEEAGRPTIQGWAIVENTTDEDWKNVELSLVAGQPIGFVMDLYEPLFLTRPQVPVPVMRGIGPVVYEGGEQAGYADEWLDADAGPRRMGRDRAKSAEMAPPAAAPGTMRRGFSADDMTSYAAASQARAGEIGEVFQYTLEQPVSIDRQQSAMLPILTAPLDGRRVSIYNTAVLEDHPMRGVEITNSSNLQLLPGPISVFDGAAFAGDAQIGHVSIGDERLLSYAVDLDVDVQSQDQWTGDVTSIRIVRGYIEQTVKSTRSTEYTITNKDKKRPRTMIVEHPKMGGWDLVSPQKATEETDSLYRFEAMIEAGKASRLKVQMEQVQTQSYAVVGFDLGTLLEFHRQGKASPAVVDAVRQAAALQAEVVRAQRRIESLEEEVRSITSDQNRIRSNMGSIDRNSDLYRRYVTKLNEQETRLEQIQQELEDARAERLARQQAVDNFVANLNVS